MYVDGTPRSRRTSELTQREREVLGLVAEGLVDSEIAGVLGLARATVRTQVGVIRLKLDARTRAHAVAIAKDRGIL